MIPEDPRVNAISVVDVGSYLPDAVVDLDFFRAEGAGPVPMEDSPLFGPPRLRRHVAPGERAGDLIAAAATPMFERLGIEPDGNVDLLITNVLLPDQLFTGCGAETAHRLGCTPEWIIDLHNGGCASFIYMLKIAQRILAGGGARTALLATVQNSAGQVFSHPAIRQLPHAVVPGDGCGVAYVRAGGEGSEVLGVRTRNTPAVALDLGPSTQDGRAYWAPGEGALDVRFDPAKTADTLALGNRLVPELVTELCADIGIGVDEIDLLITNQPNRIFLRNWRQALDIDADRHLDTFDVFGNLFGAGALVTLDHAVRAGRVRDGDLVVVAGFAHAGDFAAASALRWRA
jgi:3-oxoacyl-[acyl-carrier-protein] synthase-3